MTKDGTTVTGKLLNQDATSVQMMNPKEELKTYLRADICAGPTTPDKGLMPSVEEEAERTAGGGHRQRSELR